MSYDFSLVVPCYNEQEGIKHTIKSLRLFLGKVETYELLVVNDGSKDFTAQILAELTQEDSHLRVIHHRHNKGYGAALKTGIRFAKSELIVITDADGTYPNERIPNLVELAHERSADMIVGARTTKDVKYPLIRRVPKFFLIACASWLVGEYIPDMNSGLRVFRKSVAGRFIKILPNSFSFTTTITMATMLNGYDVHFVEISYTKRIGKSKIKPLKDTIKFTQLIIRMGMYFAPLRVLMPIIVLLILGAIISFIYDLLVPFNLTDMTILLIMLTFNVLVFALLADMIDKRVPN